MVKSNAYVKTALAIGLKLLLICAVVAGVVSFVYSATIDAYNANIAAEIQASMKVIFDASESDVIEHTLYEGTLDSDVSAIYMVKKNGESVGYCINLEGKGFGGSMNLMVGYRTDKTICGVSVVSHAETPGVGDKATKAQHLAQYIGLSGKMTIAKNGNADITAISGATVSSKAIHAALERANEIIAALPMA
jgi:electron transport complex protein RnfG